VIFDASSAHKSWLVTKITVDDDPVTLERRASYWTLGAPAAPLSPFWPNGSQAWSASDGIIQPPYCDFDLSSSPVPLTGCSDDSRLAIRVKDPTGGHSLNVEWGRQRLPVAHVTGVSPASASVGQTVTLAGTFGTEQSTYVDGGLVNRGAVLRQNLDGNQDLHYPEQEFGATMVWDQCDSAQLTVPFGVPSGDYQVMAWEEFSYEGAGHQAITAKRYGTWALLHVQ